MKNIPIGEVLKEYGYLSEDQLSQALEFQKNNKEQRLGEVLVNMGYVTEQQVLSALGQKLNLSFVTIATYPVEREAVERIPRQFALKYKMLAVAQQHGRLLVAMNDPLNFYAIEDIRLVAGMPVDTVLSLKADIMAAIEYHYAEIDAKSAALKANKDVDNTIASFSQDSDLDEDDQTPVVKLLNSLLVRGYNTNASDIHIEPFEDKTLVRMRIDGMLIEYLTLATTLHGSLIARTKILGSLDIAEKRIPQDGHFKVTIEGFEMNVRVSVIPTVYGEKAVLRFLNTNTTIDRSETFGMDEENSRKLLEMLQNPHGIIYITGPTGSGKTTTLYLVLERLVKQQVNILTIEDPVERNIYRINQMQVNNLAGLTFESGLRAILRQDPDMIMVGETRDSQTAEISVRAAITGHLVLSTLHTNDAVSAIVRIEDMGIEPYLVASSLAGVVAQRLVKKICTHCKEEYAPDHRERVLLGDDATAVWRGKGCHICNNTGYKGRVAIHEVVSIDQEIRKMITERQPIANVYQYVAQTQGATSLRENAKRLVLQGVTTVDELIRLTYGA